MVWIHGGAFAMGSGNAFLYGPDHLVSAGVVLVTLNYRLGALGFLSLENDEVSGNMGLKVGNKTFCFFYLNKSVKLYVEQVRYWLETMFIGSFIIFHNIFTNAFEVS